LKPSYRRESQTLGTTRTRNAEYTREIVNEIPERVILVRRLLGLSKYGDPNGPRVMVWLLIIPRLWI